MSNPAVSLDSVVCHRLPMHSMIESISFADAYRQFGLRVRVEVVFAGDPTSLLHDNTNNLYIVWYGKSFGTCDKNDLLQGK